MLDDLNAAYNAAFFLKNDTNKRIVLFVESKIIYKKFFSTSFVWIAMFANIFRGRKINVERLLRYGFYAKDNHFIYETIIFNGMFKLYVLVSKDNYVDADLLDLETNDLYILYKTKASGAFVSEIRSEIETILTEIADTCFDLLVFKNKQTLKIIKYVQNTYGDELEFLWKKSPGNAIWRRKDNKKWYGALLTIAGNKIGLDTSASIEIIDLRLQSKQIDLIVDNKSYFPGWHMNKKTWYTILLNNSVTTEEICRRIDTSYELAKRK